MRKGSFAVVCVASGMKYLITITLLLAVTPGLFADDWCGFHGLEKEGRCDSAAIPSTWSSSQNIAWKTAIPGRGHSSPIVSGDAVYVTTAYEKVHVSTVAGVWRYGVFALCLLFAITGINSAAQKFGVEGREARKAGQYIRLFLFAQCFVAIVVVSLFGRRLLNPDDVIIRHWLVSIVMVLCCLAVSSLLVPLRSPQQLGAALLSCAFAIPAFLTLTHGAFDFDLGSSRGVVLLLAAVLPLVVGLALCTAYCAGRRSRSTMVEARNDTAAVHRGIWSFILTGVAGATVGLLPFLFFLFRAADYRMPDSYLWSTRVGPDLSWQWVALYVTLVTVFTAGAVFWRRIHGRGNAARKFPWQQALFLASASLGLAYFVGIGVGETPKESVRAVVCLDLNNGEIRWICEGLTVQPRAESRIVTHASATPATDGKRIYAYFGEDGLMCVDPEGNLLWKMTEPIFRGKFGVGNSPVVKDGVLVIVSDMKEPEELPSSIAAFDCASGKRLWQKSRIPHEFDAAYTTPLIRSLNGKKAVLVHGWYGVKGYDLGMGQELWSYPMSHKGRHLVASMVSDNDHLYAIGARDIRAFTLSKLGTDSDPLAWSMSLPGEKSSTPVVADGLLFLVTETGTAVCLDAQTGEILWRTRLKGRYFSSVISAADRVFFTSQAGQTTVVAVDRELQLLSDNHLGESVYASLVPTGNRVLVRTPKHLHCIRGSKQQ